MKDNNLGSLKQLLPLLAPYKTTVSIATFALLLTSVLTLSIGQSIRFLIDQGFVAGSMSQLNIGLAVLMGIACFMAAATFIRFYLVTWLGERIAADLRQKVFDSIVYLHPSYFEENRSGEIMSRLTADSTLLQSIIGSSISFALRSGLMMLGGLVMLFITNFKLSLIVLFAVPLVLLPVKIFGKKVRDLSKQSQDRVADVGTYAGEIIQQIKTVQAYTQEDTERQAFANEVERAFATAKHRIRNRATLTASVILMAFLAIATMVWVGGYDVLNGNMSAGDLAAFIFYALIVASGVASVSEVWGEVQRAAGATERLIGLMNQQSNIVEPEHTHTNNEASNALIEFDNVSFAYPSHPEKKVIQHLNLAIKPGETLALVGASGAGKSTLIELMLRFYDPQSGEIKLNGTNIKHYKLSDLREHMALVPQQPTLFSSDVWHNIRYGCPDATDEQVKQAAEQAYASEFIEQLVSGYDSFLGEQGVRLSGGQKQRLIIARAILNDPQILLLDEATSALDANSEQQVQKALEALMKNRTTIIIAHRLATIRDADRIAVMDQGEIAAIGTHEQLLAQSPLYKNLCELQFGANS